MFYVIFSESKWMLGCYAIPTKERADKLAHCMSGYWKMKNVRVSENKPTEKDGMYTDYGCIKVADDVTHPELIYCIDKALNWKPGMKRIM